MSGPTDWDDLAKRYLDLWQEQLAALGADQQLSDQFARLAQDMAARGAAMPLAGFTPPTGGSSGGQPGSSDAPGSAAAGHAPGQRDQRLDELERRVAAVEKRLDELASRAGS